MNGAYPENTDALLADFRTAGRRLAETVKPLIGVLPASDLLDEIDGQIGRLRGLVGLHAARGG